jgi:uncharacterized membrane protein YqaE (UPF0057 family)
MSVYARPKMDLALYAVILLLFATWSTLHLLLCFRLRVFGKWRALAGFLLPPVAPYWGLRLGERALSLTWILFALSYIMSLMAGFAG